MNYCNLSIAKDIVDNEDSILSLIAKTWLQEESDEIWNLAEMKDCEIEDITEQDCIDYLKRQPKAIQYFFKRYSFFVEKIEDLEQLQKNGILNRLPNDCKISIDIQVINSISTISEDNIEKFKGKNLIFHSKEMPANIFNSIIENGFEINPNHSQICLNNINSQNIYDTNRNISRYPNERFVIPMNINSIESEDLDLLEYMMNYDFDVDNVNMLVNIDVNNADLSNIFNILKQTPKNFEKISRLTFNISNKRISSLEQFIQNIDLINSNNFPNMSFRINLDENYIKSLDKSTVEKIDTYLTELRNSQNISFSIDYKPGVERVGGFRFEDINSCFQLCNKTEDIIGCIPRDASDLEKVTYISNWIMQNFSYDYENYQKKKEWEEQNPNAIANDSNRIHLKTRNLVEFLDDKTGVCQDVAELTEYLLKKVGVECEHISSNNHSFNRVYIDSIPYWMDNTWDINSHDENKDYQLSDSEYFLTSYEDFFKTHSKYDAIYHSPACPKTMNRENIKTSLERTSKWKHILEKSIMGSQLYANTRSGELIQVGQNFENSINNEKIEKEGEISDGEY